MQVRRSCWNWPRTGVHAVAAVSRPGTTTSVSGPRPEQCSHWRTPSAATTALNVDWVAVGVVAGLGRGEAFGLVGDRVGEADGDVLPARLPVGSAVAEGCAAVAGAAAQPATIRTASRARALIAAAPR